MEKIVEVIKEVPIEIKGDTQIVIKEVIKEVTTNSSSTLEFELENKIKKTDLLQQHLQSEIDGVNRKEIELNHKEKCK